MLLSMTIENFKSVKSAQTISFEAVKDSRLDPSKVIAVNDKINLIKTSAVIGPNGAGKSSFVRALEVLGLSSLHVRLRIRWHQVFPERYSHME